MIQLPVYTPPFTIRKLAKPDFLPAVGSVGAINLNTMKDMDPCPSNTCVYSADQGQGAVTSNWTSGALVKDAGVGGMLMAHGGGGNSYYGCEVYGWDCGTRLHSMVSPPSIALNKQGSGLTGPNDPNFNLIWGEHPDGKPASGHSYGSYAALSAKLSGRRQGVFLKVRNTLAYGYATSNGTHGLDIDTGEWYRAATTVAPMNLNSEYTACATAEQRRCVYAFETKGNIARICKLSFPNQSGVGVWSEEATLPWWPGTGGQLHYWAEKDLLVFIGQSSNNAQTQHSMIAILDPKDFAHSPTFVTLSGDIIPSSAEGVSAGGYGLTQSDADTLWAYVPVNIPPLVETQNLYKITLPSVQRIVMPGPTINQDRHQGIWGAFVYADWYKSLIWPMWTTGEMWAYRVA